MNECENPIDVFSDYRSMDSRHCEAELDGKAKIGGDIEIKGIIEAGVRFIIEKCEEAAGKVATGYRGDAAETGDNCHAAATGNRGHAVVTGGRGHAAATGEGGHAAATGKGGHAVAIGDDGHATTTGYRGNAATAGYRGHALAAGNRSNAIATGYRGNAAATGEGGHAVVTGYGGHAVAIGNRGNAETKDGIAAAFGREGKAKGGKIGSWIVLSDWRYENGEWKLYGVKAKEVDGKSIKPGVWYTMKNGRVVEAE